MKIRSFFILVLLAAVSVVSCRHRSGDIQVKVKDTDDYYRFTAIFDEKKTQRVYDCINREIAPTHIESTEDIDIETILDDKTRFKWESSPGELLIYIDKDENSQASYHRIRNMCERIKTIVGDSH